MRTPASNLRDVGVAGSNPVTPTIDFKAYFRNVVSLPMNAPSDHWRCDKVTAEHRQFWTAGAASQSRSTAKRLRSASEQKLKAPSCVARKTTRGARPACSASCQRGAHRHQRSPGFSPGKPNSGTGVERSLPQDFEYSRNPAVMTAHTVWLPISSRLVSQQPSRKKPVIGLKEQTSSRSPSTFLASLRRPPPLPASSLNIGILCIVIPPLLQECPLRLRLRI